MDNFVVGLSNSSAVPVRGYYVLCGQYPGPAANGANLSLQCNPRTASGRYVIVQQAINGDGYLTICEIEIYSGQVRNSESCKATKDLLIPKAIFLTVRTSLQRKLPYYWRNVM